MEQAMSTKTAITNLLNLSEILSPIYFIPVLMILGGYLLIVSRMQKLSPKS
jgi:hypothetical protein